MIKNDEYRKLIGLVYLYNLDFFVCGIEIFQNLIQIIKKRVELGIDFFYSFSLNLYFVF